MAVKPIVDDRKLLYAAVKTVRIGSVEMVIVPVSMPSDMAAALMAGIKVEQPIRAATTRAMTAGSLKNPPVWADVLSWLDTYTSVQTVSYSDVWQLPRK